MEAATIGLKVKVDPDWPNLAGRLAGLNTATCLQSSDGRPSDRSSLQVVSKYTKLSDLNRDLPVSPSLRTRVKRLVSNSGRL